MNTTNKNNSNDLLFLSTLILITILVGVDGFMYLPAFPEIIKYFNVKPEEATLVSRLGLMGLGIGCLFIGSLSNSYGKRKILLYGLLIYVVAGLCATLSTNFYLLLVSCFIIGVAKSVPTVICSTIILDKYNADVANKKLLVLRMFSLPVLIIAPTIAGLIASKLGWRFNFATVSIIVIITYFLVLFNITDDHKDNSAQNFSIRKMLHEYKILLTNFKYIGNAFIMIFPSTVMTIFMNNIPIIFIGKGDLTSERFGMYGSLLMLVMMVFSYISIIIAQKKNLDYLNRAGFITAISGALTVIITIALARIHIYEIYHPICALGMLICVSGMSMMNGFLVKASMAVPEMRALAVSFMFTLNNIFDARGIFWAQVFYDGTLVPVQIIMLILVTIAIISYIMLSRIYKRESSQTNTIS